MRKMKGISRWVMYVERELVGSQVEFTRIGLYYYRTLYY